MTIILFLVDSSASMAQRNYVGCTGIDTAKAIVQDILKLRQRDINNRQTDRYMLLTTEEFPLCVKAGWKEGSGVFHDQLKALRPCGKFPLKQAIQSSLYFVNLNRAQTGVDYYGHGRFPHLQESVIIINITDSCGVSELPADFELRPDSKIQVAPGTEYTEESFRWDQRMFSIVLRMRSQAPLEGKNATAPVIHIEPGVIQRVCASTGGRTFTMTSHKQQTMIVEQLTSLIHINGINLRFEFPAPNMPPRNGVGENGEITEERKAEIACENLKKSLEFRPITFVFTRNRAPGHWPIPEAFWPESIQNNMKLPVRKAHPMLTIGFQPTDVQVNTEFPFDKYELDPACAITEFVRERTAALGSANVCWQVFVMNSYRTPGSGKPFGFLKTATNGTSVNLFLMPYNYPILLRLLDEQKADPRLRGHPDWRRKLDTFVDTSPSYYKQQLKKALARIKLTGGILDEPAQNLYGPTLSKSLANMKNIGKEEMDKLISEIGARVSKAPRPVSYLVSVERREKIGRRKNFRVDWEEEKRGRLAAARAADEPPKKKIRSRLPIPATRNNTVVIEDDIGPDPELPESTPPAPEVLNNMQIDLHSIASVNQVYRNPFSIEKDQLAQMLPRLRINLEQQLRDSPIPALEGGLPGVSCKLQTAYELHSLPASQMGNYDEYIKSLEMIGAAPLREVEHRAMRENTFGNPFKKDKKSLAVDEVGEAPAASRGDSSGMSKKDRRAMEGNRPPRRKAGPLAMNSMQMWRERRRTASLSTVSDLSHTGDDLSEELMEKEEEGNSMDLDGLVSDLTHFSPSSPSTTRLNGKAVGGGGASPAGSVGSRDSGVSEWGLEDEAEEEDDGVIILDDDEEPVGKKAKLDPLPSSTSSSSSLSRRARSGESLERIRDMKAEVCRMVRMFLSDSAIFSKVEALFGSLSMQSLLIMTKFARDEAKRFKKRSLTSSLQERLDELEVVANGIM